MALAAVRHDTPLVSEKQGDGCWPGLSAAWHSLVSSPTRKGSTKSPSSLGSGVSSPMSDSTRLSGQQSLDRGGQSSRHSSVEGTPFGSSPPRQGGHGAADPFLMGGYPPLPPEIPGFNVPPQRPAAFLPPTAVTAASAAQPPAPKVVVVKQFNGMERFMRGLTFAAKRAKAMMVEVRDKFTRFQKMAQAPAPLPKPAPKARQMSPVPSVPPPAPPPAVPPPRSSDGSDVVEERQRPPLSSGPRIQEDVVGQPVVDGIVVKQPGDGACLFRSIAFGLDDRYDGLQIRRLVAELIEKEPTHTIANTTVSDWIRNEGYSGSNVQYARDLLRGDFWGGDLEIALAAHLLEINIHVYKHFGNRFRRITSFNVPNAMTTVNVVYQPEPSSHYDALLVQQGR